jgi:hypothetical protein
MVVSDAVGGVPAERAAVPEEAAEPAGVLAVDLEEVGELLHGGPADGQDLVDEVVERDLFVVEHVDHGVDGAILREVPSAEVGTGRLGVVPMAASVHIALRRSDRPAPSPVGGAAGGVGAVNGPRSAWASVRTGGGAGSAAHSIYTPMVRRIRNRSL